jgi:UDP-glucose 4-epimerase
MTDPAVILVTGGAGFIGSHVVEILVNQGHRVTVLDDLSGGNLENLPPGCEFVKGDIADNPLVGNLFKSHQFDLVYHLAAYAAEGLSQLYPAFQLPQ